MSGLSNEEGLALRWDVPLTDAEVNALPPRERAVRNDSSLARKAALIVSAALCPDRPYEWLPMNRTELRQWSDPARRLWPWKGREVDARSGRNGELMDQIYNAWRVSTAAVARRNANPRTLRPHKKIDLLLLENAALKRQVVELMRRINGQAA